MKVIVLLFVILVLQVSCKENFLDKLKQDLPMLETVFEEVLKLVDGGEAFKNASLEMPTLLEESTDLLKRWQKEKDKKETKPRAQHRKKTSSEEGKKGKKEAKAKAKHTKHKQRTSSHSTAKPEEGTYIPGNPKYANMPAGFEASPVPDNMKHGQYAYFNEPEPAHPISSGITSISELKKYHYNKNQMKNAQQLINEYGFIPENDFLEHLRQHRMIEHRNKQHLDDALHTVAEVAKEVAEHVVEDEIIG